MISRTELVNFRGSNLENTPARPESLARAAAAAGHEGRPLRPLRPGPPAVPERAGLFGK